MRYDRERKRERESVCVYVRLCVRANVKIGETAAIYLSSKGVRGIIWSHPPPPPPIFLYPSPAPFTCENISEGAHICLSRSTVKILGLLLNSLCHGLHD